MYICYISLYSLRHFNVFQSKCKCINEFVFCFVFDKPLFLSVETTSKIQINTHRELTKIGVFLFSVLRAHDDVCLALPQQHSLCCHFCLYVVLWLNVHCNLPILLRWLRLLRSYTSQTHAVGVTSYLHVHVFHT